MLHVEHYATPIRLQATAAGVLGCGTRPVALAASATVSNLYGKHENKSKTKKGHKPRSLRPCFEKGCRYKFIPAKETVCLRPSDVAAESLEI